MPAKLEDLTMKPYTAHSQPMFTENIYVNWLDRLSGTTVAEAVEFLQSLDPDAVLTYDVEADDTSGLEVTSKLVKSREPTPEELREVKLSTARYLRRRIEQAKALGRPPEDTEKTLARILSEL